MADPTLEIWIEFGSTYSHIAVHRIEAAAAPHGVPLAWRVFLLGPIFKAQGWDDSPFNLYPAKGAYMWRDMERLCQKHGVPFQRPSQFPRNGLLAARIATAGESEPWLPAFIRGVFRANFAEDRDIRDAACLSALLKEAGCDSPETFLERAASPEVKARLRERTEQAQSLGLFGAPSFVAAGEVFWGQDRIEDALAWVQHPSS